MFIEILKVLLATIIGVVFDIPLTLFCLITFPFIFTLKLPGSGNVFSHAFNLGYIFILSLFDTFMRLITPFACILGLFLERNNLSTLEDRNLPTWLSWFDNYKDPLGDVYWKTNPEHANGHEKEMEWRLRWLMRNPCNNLGYNVMGWTTSNSTHYIVDGDRDVSDQPVGKSGVLHVEALENGKAYQCYYLVQKYPGFNRCFRAYLGWKNKGLDRDGRKVQFVAAVNPLKSYVS